MTTASTDVSPVELDPIFSNLPALSPADRERVQELSGKASEGLLTEEESAEMDSYLTVGSALEFLKAKARLSLRRGNLGP